MFQTTNQQSCPSRNRHTFYYQKLQLFFNRKHVLKRPRDCWTTISLIFLAPKALKQLLYQSHQQWSDVSGRVRPGLPRSQGLLKPSLVELAFHLQGVSSLVFLGSGHPACLCSSSWSTLQRHSCMTSWLEKGMENHHIRPYLIGKSTMWFIFRSKL